MQDRVVVIINGKPRSGKDSFCKFITEYCENNGEYCDVWSTIDTEKEILEEYIKQYDITSDIDRGFLSDFKQLLNEYYDYTFETFKNILELYEGILLVHTREWPEILRFKNYCAEKDIKFITVYISGTNERNDFTNYSDKFCEDRRQMYDYKIENFGTLEDLQENAKQFCKSRLF